MTERSEPASQGEDQPEVPAATTDANVREGGRHGVASILLFPNLLPRATLVSLKNPGGLRLLFLRFFSFDVSECLVCMSVHM